MKYLISQQKMINMVGSYLKGAYPKFNKENVRLERIRGENERTYFTDSKTDEILATVWEDGELTLKRDIFEELEGFFGAERMTYVIEWFNDEFGTKAEYVSF